MAVVPHHGHLGAIEIAVRAGPADDDEPNARSAITRRRHRLVNDDARTLARHTVAARRREDVPTCATAEIAECLEVARPGQPDGVSDEPLRGGRRRGLAASRRRTTRQDPHADEGRGRRELHTAQLAICTCSNQSKLHVGTLPWATRTATVNSSSRSPRSV
jgi:hypothetical protein